MPLFLLLFLGLGLAEIAVFIQVGDMIGILPTLLAILGSLVIGILLVRMQGLSTVKRARDAMDRGEPPVLEMVEGVCLVLAGMLLVIPGFLTDLVGLLLVIPPVRRAVAERIARRMKGRGHIFVAAGRTTGTYRPGPGPHPGQRPGAGPNRAPGGGQGTIIDGEYEEVREPEAADRGPSGSEQEELPAPESRWGSRRR